MQTSATGFSAKLFEEAGNRAIVRRQLVGALDVGDRTLQIVEVKAQETAVVPGDGQGRIARQGLFEGRKGQIGFSELNECQSQVAPDSRARGSDLGRAFEQGAGLSRPRRFQMQMAQGGQYFEILTTHPIEGPQRLGQVVDALPDTALFNVIAFADAAETMAPDLVLANDSHRENAKRFLRPFNLGGNWGLSSGNVSQSRVGLKAAGGTTRLDLAISAALKMQADTILIISDDIPRVGRIIAEPTMARINSSDSGRL